MTCYTFGGFVKHLGNFFWILAKTRGYEVSEGCESGTEY